MRFFGKYAAPILIGLVFGGVATLDFFVRGALHLRNAPVIVLRPGWRFVLTWIEVPYLFSALFMVFVTILFLGLRLWDVRIKCLLFLLLLSTHIFALGSGHMESTSVIIPLFLFVTALDLLMGGRLDVTPVSFLVLALVAFEILSLVHGQFGPFSRFIREFKYLGIYFLVLFNVRDLKQLKFVMKGFIVLAAFSAVFGVLQEILFVSVGFELLGNIPEEHKGVFLYQESDFGTLLRAQGFFGVPGVYGTVMAVAGSFVSYLILSKGPKLFKYRFHLYPTFVFLVLSVILAFNRGAYAMLAIGAILSLYLARPSRAIHITALLLLLPVLTGAALVASPKLADKAIGYLEKEFSSGDIRDRLGLNGRALTGVITKHPIIGAGMGQGAVYTADYRRWPAHSVPIQAAADIGIIGALVFLSIYAVAFVRLLPVMGSRNAEHRYLAQALLVGFVPLFLQMLNEPFFLRFPYGWILIGMMESLTVLSSRETAS